MIDHEDPLQYSETVKECWSVHQVLRQLGFDSSDIYIAAGKDIGEPQFPACLFVILKAQGKEFSVNVGGYSSEGDVESDIAQWTTFATLFNEGFFDKEKLKDVYKRSTVMKNKVFFIDALLKKGFRISTQAS